MTIAFPAGPPNRAVGQQRRRGIEQDLISIVAMAGPGWTIDSPPVTEAVKRQTGDLDMPMIARAVLSRVKRDLRQWRIIPFQWLHDEGHLGAVSAEECEIESVVSARNAEGKRPAAG